MEKPKGQCPICKRELGKKRLSKHHLIPLSRGGRHGETVLLHNICHQKIHSVFTEKELKKEYYSVEKILSHEAIQKFVKWVAKKAPAYYDSSKKTKREREWKRTYLK